jgi:hypothetical protein
MGFADLISFLAQKETTKLEPLNYMHCLVIVAANLANLIKIKSCHQTSLLSLEQSRKLKLQNWNNKMRFYENIQKTT